MWGVPPGGAEGGVSHVFPGSVCLSMSISFEDWHLAANQEVGHSFPVGGCEILHPAFLTTLLHSAIASERSKKWLNWLSRSIPYKKHLRWNFSKWFLYWVSSWIQWLPGPHLIPRFSYLPCHQFVCDRTRSCSSLGMVCWDALDTKRHVSREIWPGGVVSSCISDPLQESNLTFLDGIVISNPLSLLSFPSVSCSDTISL